MRPLWNALGPLGHRPLGLPFGSGSTLLNGLVSWWDLDETSGPRYDSVGSNDLTDVNTVGYASGKIGNAASFVAANSESLSITMNSSLDVGTTGDGFTLSCWATTVNTNNTRCVCAVDSGTAEKFALFGPLSARYYARVNAGSQQQVTSDVISDSNFHHIVMWFDPSDQKVYISIDNNTPRSSAATSSSNVKSDTTSDFKVGNWTFGAFDDDVDLLGLWDRVLTADERTELYASGAGRSYPFSE